MELALYAGIYLVLYFAVQFVLCARLSRLPYDLHTAQTLWQVRDQTAFCAPEAVWQAYRSVEDEIYRMFEAEVQGVGQQRGVLMAGKAVRIGDPDITAQR